MKMLREDMKEVVVQQMLKCVIEICDSTEEPWIVLLRDTVREDIDGVAMRAPFYNYQNEETMKAIQLKLNIALCYISEIKERFQDNCEAEEDIENVIRYLEIVQMML